MAKSKTLATLFPRTFEQVSQEWREADTKRRPLLHDVQSLMNDPEVHCLFEAVIPAQDRLPQGFSRGTDIINTIVHAQEQARRSNSVHVYLRIKPHDSEDVLIAVNPSDLKRFGFDSQRANQADVWSGNLRVVWSPDNYGTYSLKPKINTAPLPDEVVSV